MSMSQFFKRLIVHQLRRKDETSWKKCSRVLTELEAMRMNDSKDVSSNITCLQTVVIQLKHNGCKGCEEKFFDHWLMTLKMLCCNWGFKKFGRNGHW